jgi:hypothetical protein
VAIRRRHILYNYDRQELASTRVYDSYTEAVDFAGQLQDVVVLSLEFEESNSPGVTDYE